jgi:Tfp pilus assembly protein FimT
MGNQQLLILAIAMVLLAIAVAVGITWFQDQAVSSNRDELGMDLAQFAVRAQAYYRRPRTLGGGEGSFGALTIDKVTSQSRNLNGTYTLETDPVPQDAQTVKLIGIGTESASDGIKVKVVMLVGPDSVATVAAEGH